MITLTADWLRAQLPTLAADGYLSVELNSWDNEDSFTLVTLSPFGSQTRVFGRIIFGEENAPAGQVQINLIKIDSTNTNSRGGRFTGSDGQLYLVTASVLTPSGKKDLPIEIAEVTAALIERRKTILESNLLIEKTIFVIGLGTGGVHVAIELAKAGVGRFILMDPDRLTVGNVARHQAGISQTGRRKVYSARDMILDKNPAANVEIYTVAANTSNTELVRQLVRKSDVTVCATDGRPSKLFVNRICTEENRTAIYGGAFRRAYGGQVLRVRPGVSPCYQCFVMAMPEKEEDQEVASLSDTMDLAYTDRPVPIEPGLSIDVAPIALMVTKLTLQELLIGKHTTLKVLDRDLAAHWYLWLNRPEPGTPYAELPPLSESSDDMTILRWYGIDFAREITCPVCGNFNEAMRTELGLVDTPLPDIPSR